MHGNDAATCMKIIQPNPWKVLRDRRKAQCAQFVAEVGTASPPLQVHQSGMEIYQQSDSMPWDSAAAFSQPSDPLISRYA